MTDTTATVFKTNRILVTLDASARGRAALEAAIRLALDTSSEIQGLFIEDEDLVRLASLPFASEVDCISASPRQLHLANMERELRGAAAEAHQAFANAVEQVNLRWTFRVARGAVTQVSLSAAGDCDLLVIGQQARSPRRLTGDYLPQRIDGGRRVVAIFDGSPSAFRALEFASSVAQPSPLSVLVLAKDGQEIAEKCIAWLEQRNIRAEVDQTVNPSHDAVIDFARKWPPRVLVINRDSDFISDSEIGRLINEFECPLILC